MKKALKATLSCLLTLCLLLTPFSGVLVFAVNSSPDIDISIRNLDYVLADTVISVQYSANGDATLTACDTRLEGKTIDTDADVAFTPAEQGLTNGVYTLVAKATDSNGETTIKAVSFRVVSEVEIDFTYAEDESIVPSLDDATASYYAVTPLDYTVGYGITQDGNVNAEDATAYSAYAAYAMQYWNEELTNNSASGIPYQMFDIALNGQTDGEIIVRQTGATYSGERIALKVYNPSTDAWDTLGTYNGSDSVSAAVDVPTYADNDQIHVMAILDYVTNGSNTMIWSTDPQHYTKFEDLNEYYYQVYQYAAQEYVNGNVGYIITTGDLVDDLPSTSEAVKQWQVADQAMSYVEAVDMPNGLVSGNHDVKTFKSPDYTQGDAAVDYSKYWETFPASRYNTKAWYGGSLNNNASHYDLITIGNVDFVVLYLGYGVEATDETIVWANNVLETYSHRTAIVATHQYLDAATGDRAPASRAQLMFDKIVDPNPNVKMVLCGHDDGSIVNEVTASDGRIVYELLADYQFVEAEDPDFYANEHYIGSVPHCCGDGYIRLLTVEGDKLSSITYSPITDRYNPYGDGENITVDLDCGIPNRFMSTVSFSAYVLGEEIEGEALYTTNNAIVISKQVSDAVVPEPPVDAPATPAEPYFAHAAKTAPTVEYKTDVLAAAGLANNIVNTGWAAYNNLNLNVDLTKTPYLYYSFDVPEGGNFTFALVNNTNYAPWLVFRDATGEGAFLNNGNANWDSYKNREQYITASETGCVDMRTISTDPNKATWIVNQLTLYNANQLGVTVNYLFFGSEPNNAVEIAPTQTAFTSYHHVSYATYPAIPEQGTDAPVDLAALEAIAESAAAIDLTPYTQDSADALNAALNEYATVDKTNQAAVQEAYHAIVCAVAELTEPAQVIDPATLKSVHLYTMTKTKWSTSDTVMTGLDVGFMLSRNTKNGWASANNSDAYSIKSNNGKIYVNLDVDADCAWSIHLIASQANVSGTIVINHAIDNAFNRIDRDSYKGKYSGVYDITEAFTAIGMDPSATISITKTYLYLVPGDGAPQYSDLATNPDTVSYKYLEFMTDVASTDIVDKSALEAVIAQCNALDEALYTTGSWKKLQAALTVAEKALTNNAYVQADFNLEVIKLENAMAKLKLLTDIIPEPEGSLLPADEGLWVEYQANTSEVYRDENNYTVIQNTNGLWPSLTYTYPEALVYNTADYQLSVDMTVNLNSRVDLQINGKWVNVGKYITGGKMNGDDMLAGTYTVNIPLTDFVAAETASITATMVYSIGGPAASSAVTIRQMQITDYVAPPHVEDVKFDIIPESVDDVTIGLVSGDTVTQNNGTVTIDPETGVLTAVNNGEGDLRIILNNAEYFNLEALNSLHLDIDTEAAFKIAVQVASTANGSSKWLNTSDNYPSVFTIENDRVAAGAYDVNLEIRDLSTTVTDKTSCYFQSFIILVREQGAFKLNVAEMIEHDNFVWDESLTTYGPAATPENPYYAHAAQKAPEVAEKFDLLKAINYATHPTITGWTKIGDQATNPLGLEIDISKTPYLYYSFVVPEGGNFTFAMYGNSNYCPWLSFLDSTADVPFINQGAANWDAYTQREQYATTSQTGCIDMRPLLKNPDVLKWIVTQINFYNSTGKNVIISYFFFGSEPIETEPDEPEVILGDLNNDGDVTLADAMKIFYSVNEKVTLTEAETAAADINGDGEVTLADAMKVFYFVNEKIDTLG